MSLLGKDFYLAPKGRLLKFVTRTHISLYRRTGGLLGMALPAPDDGWRRLNCLLLTTTGRKSGLQRTVALPFFQPMGRLILFGSNSGQQKHPAWFVNLRATPRVEVQIGEAVLEASAKIIEGADHSAMWERHIAEWPRWDRYQQGVERQIPIVELVLGPTVSPD